MYDDEIRIRGELSRGEKLVWTGRPGQGVVFRSVDILLIPFSLLWGGFAVFWEVTAFQSGAPVFFLLFGVPFVIIGLFIIFGRFIYDMLRRRNVIYGLTDKRLLFFSKSGVRSVLLDEARDVKYTAHNGRRGTIQFGERPSMFSLTPAQQMGIWTGSPLTPTFEKVEDGDHVYREVKRLIGL